MTIAVVTVCDAIRINAGHLPKGPAAGYSTGTGIVPWGPAEWKAHPGAVRICQDPGATDTTADVLDVEAGAATVSKVAGWAEAAAANVAAGTRPGQRHPAVYMSLSAVTPVVNALIGGGIREGVGLWVANWNLTAAEAAVLVTHAGGPFPVIGVQYGNRGAYDVSVFSRPWLDAVSGDPAVHAAHAQGFDGHGEYITAGMFSLAQLAAKLKVPPATLLRMTADHYHTFGNDLAGYLNAVHAGTLPASAPLPKGIRFWVD
ncbi:MAG TPA: hypothetical protein VFQ68_21800 [Streptosporangiaceae bacterium]|nr:hypothetical protein [Streptosporangiaceae bacterium]